MLDTGRTSLTTEDCEDLLRQAGPDPVFEVPSDTELLLDPPAKNVTNVLNEKPTNVPMKKPTNVPMKKPTNVRKKKTDKLSEGKGEGNGIKCKSQHYKLGSKHEPIPDLDT